MDDAATLAFAEARVGQTLRGKWTLDSLIGVGGMASVYRATHRNGKRVAIKMLHPDVSVSSAVRERFLREGRAANRVGHRGVVVVDDDDVDEHGSAFLVMELLEGECVRERAVRLGGKLGTVEVLELTDQLLDVLAAAHDKGVIHRDIKPENLFLTSSGILKVLDFGIARAREPASEGMGTRLGSFMGTPAYMSPEQAQGLWDQVDAQSDLWSVGATMFNLLSGETVHVSATTNHLFALAATQRARPLEAVGPQVPRPVAEIVDRVLSFGKQDRFADARQMQLAVRRARAALEPLGKAEPSQPNAPVAAVTAGSEGESLLETTTRGRAGADDTIRDPRGESFLEVTTKGRSPLEAISGGSTAGSMLEVTTPTPRQRLRSGLVAVALGVAGALLLGLLLVGAAWRQRSMAAPAESDLGVQVQPTPTEATPASQPAAAVTAEPAPEITPSLADPTDGGTSKKPSPEGAAPTKPPSSKKPAPKPIDPRDIRR